MLVCCKSMLRESVTCNCPEHELALSIFVKVCILLLARITDLLSFVFLGQRSY